jgi:hypothetical protein
LRVCGSSGLPCPGPAPEKQAEYRDVRCAASPQTIGARSLVIIVPSTFSHCGKHWRCMSSTK